jgi:hypothetical protein
MLIYLCETKPKTMNLEITPSERHYLIDGLTARIQTLEKLIPVFTRMTLVAEYVKEVNNLKELRTKLLSI